MNEPETLEALLGRARQSAPAPLNRRAVRAKIDRELGSRQRWGVKAVAGGALAAVGLVAWLLAGEAPPTATQVVAPPQPQPQPPPMAMAMAPSAPVVAEPAAVRPAKLKRAEKQVERAVAEPVAEVEADHVPPVVPVPEPEPSSSIAIELALVRGAQRALSAKDANRSLVLLEEHARRFPNGVLAEERQAVRVFSYCALGRKVEARAAAALLSAGSPYAIRVQTSCANEQ